MGIAFKMILLIPLIGLFCTTKVSEWVLLNHAPANYLLIYHSSGESGQDLKKNHAELVSKINPSNVQFREVKTSDLNEPYYALYHHNRLIRKFVTQTGLSGFATSPLRKMVAGGISEENIGLMIRFLTADCSCLIKDDLQGTDNY